VPYFNESTVEIAALDWLHSLDYTVLHGETIAPGEPAAERTHYGEVLLLGRLREGLLRINTHIPAPARVEVVEETLRKVTRTQSQNPLVNNHAFHRLLVEGVDVSYHLNGQVKHDKVWLIDFSNPGANDWLVVNQFTITDVNLQSHAKTNRRPDIMLFINGLPLVIIELKNPADETATLRKAYNQLQTYQEDIPSVFTYNALLAISDGVDARLGTLGPGWERFLKDCLLSVHGQREINVLTNSGTILDSLHVRAVSKISYCPAAHTDGNKIRINSICCA